jgi:hypothetical protein
MEKEVPGKAWFTSIQNTLCQSVRNCLRHLRWH